MAERKSSSKKRAPKRAPKKPKGAAPKPHGQGAKTKYTFEMANEICDRMSAGETITKMCREEPRFPDRVTVLGWYLHGRGLSDAQFAEFHHMYLRAREAQAESWHEEMTDGARDVAEQRDSIAKQKLISDNTKWSLARMSRAKYGDSQSIELGGGASPLAVTAHVEASVDVSHLSDEKQAQLRALARETLQGGGDDES